MEESVGRGWNIKCFDKIKLTSICTGCRIHSNSFGYKSKSYNTALTCHKVRDQTDWFVALRPQEQSMSYHFRYGDQLLLSNVETKKYVHLSEEVESPVSKNMEVSLCDYDEKRGPCDEDEWIVELAESSQDDYWRVGEIVRLRHKETQAFLCAHKRKIQENDDYEVYGQKIRINSTSSSHSKPKEESSPLKINKHEQSLWMVSEITPFIYTASISEQKKVKLTEQAEELGKLKATLRTIPRKQTKRVNQTQQILKMENRRMEQIQAEKRKLQECRKKVSCWQRYFCCCCLQSEEGYSKLQ